MRIPFLVSSLFIVAVSVTAGPLFDRGVNLSGWFQGRSIAEAPLNQYNQQDFRSLRQLGVDVVRLPLDLHSFTLPGPGHRLDPRLFTFLDRAVGWAEEEGLSLILDNHSFDPAVATRPEVETILTAVWLQVAARYAKKGDFLLYEILNEPHGIDLQVWGQITLRVLKKIRTVDTRHRVVVGGAEWNSLDSLDSLPDFHDEGIVYTFHFYDPFLFTHQGADWSEPSLAPLAGVPFPYERARMPALPATLVKTWVNDQASRYADDSRVEVLEKQLSKAAAFRQRKGLPVFCGEFGVYNLNAPHADRVRWYQTVTGLLDKFDLPRTSWDCRGDFGLFLKDSEESFESDLDVEVVRALGLKALPQKPRRTGPETDDLLLFDGLTSPGIGLVTWGEAARWNRLDAGPRAGTTALTAAELPRYGTVRFEFRRSRDLGTLVEDGSLVLRLRTLVGFTSVEVRFLSVRGDDGGRIPWRSALALDATRLADTREWQTVRLPLSAFRETGAWKDAWYEPRGLFDWTQITGLELVAEAEALVGTGFSLAGVSINKPTAGPERRP